MSVEKLERVQLGLLLPRTLLDLRRCGFIAKYEGGSAFICPKF